MDQIRPSAKRRVVSGDQTLSDAIEAAKTPAVPLPVPTSRKEVSEVTRIERQIHLGDLALNQYQLKLQEGKPLSPEEQKLFLGHQDSLRKLEMSRAALAAKANLGIKSDLDVAKGMLSRGMARADVLEFFPDNDDVRDGL